MQFLVIHGSFGSPSLNWFPELKEQLESIGQTVFVPQFPVDAWTALNKAGPQSVTKNQNLAGWLRTFEAVKAELNPHQPLCIIAHSLGPVFTLHAVLQHQLVLDCAIFVAPFLEKLHKTWQIDTANSTFYKTDFDFKQLKKLIPVSYCLYSDNDPYVDSHYSLDFAHALQSSVIEVKHAGHFNADSGYTDFPLVFELCRTRIT